MPKTLLIEAHATTLKQGTGIATYARNLASTAGGMGHQVELLIGIDRPLNRRDALLSEVVLNDVKDTKAIDPILMVNRAIDWSVGVPTGAKAQRLPTPRIVLDPSSGTAGGPRHPVQGAVRLWERAFLHFNRYGSRIAVRPEGRQDLFHVTRPTPAYVKGAANVYTIHDIVPLRLPYATLDNKKYFYNIIKTLTRKADHIVTVSEFTKRDVQAFFDIPDDRITNTWQSVAVPEAALSATDDEVARDIENRYGLGFREYFLFLGAVEPKKNISRIVEAFASSGTPHPLVLVGGLGWQYERDVEAIEDERLRSWRFDGSHIKSERRIQRLPYVPQAALFNLIRGARAVLLPSLYEGFGLPILEAMLLGTPVITSNTSSLPEVAEDAAILVDPYKAETIRDAIRAIDADEGLRQDLIERGRRRATFFAPERHAERVKAVYDRLLG
ncbi:glycosyltransferase family 4 protein [Bosea sp. (in: a-proteobacteria)]|uniref:glycosyltransferase family 4 protein n=1 Tax=Bosea sp. (in: a-proteobacteria) TaxID=1871050 RepID=UPI003F716713